MRCFLTIGAVLIAASGLAQAPPTVNLTPYTVEIDNPLVRVLRVTLPPKEKPATIKHRAAVAIFLSETTYRVGGAAGKSETRKRGEVAFLTAGKRSLENVSATPAELVIIEFKTPPVTPWKAVTLDALKADPNNFVFIAENEYARVIRGYTKAPSLEHEHPTYLFVWMDGAALPFGAVRFEQGPKKHAPKPQPGESIMVEFKTEPADEK